MNKIIRVVNAIEEESKYEKKKYENKFNIIDIEARSNVLN